jgi:hypothetical protein
VLSAPTLQAETKPRVYSGMPYATLEETWLILAPGNLCLLPPVNTPFCQRQWPESGDFVWLTVFKYYLVGQTWKHTWLLIPQACVLSALLPLPHLGCQVVPSVLARISRHTFYSHAPSPVPPPCPSSLSAFPLPVLTRTLASHGKLVLWYLTSFFSYSHT